MSVITHTLVSEIANKMVSCGIQPTANKVFREAMKGGYCGTHRAVKSCLSVWRLESVDFPREDVEFAMAA